MAGETWGVVGGGILGMRLAQRLAEAGHSVCLYEAAPSLGGLASAWRLGDIIWDRHYHVTLLSDSYLRRLLEELKLDGEIRWVATRTGFYTDGRFYSMSNAFEFLAFPPLRIIDKLRLGATIFYASRIKEWSQLERIEVAEWLRRWSGKRAFEKVWLPLLRAKLGENYRITSAAFIWATIARLYAARRAGFKQEMFGYVPGGYGRILERYGERLKELGVEIHVQHPAKSIRAAGGRGVEVELQNGSRRVFDKVVTTVPSHFASSLCAGLGKEETERHKAIHYLGVLCASVLLRKPLAGFYVTNITESWVPFTAIIEMSSLVDRSEFGGQCLVYLPKYLSHDDPMFDRPDEEIRHTFVAALRRMHPHVSDEDILSFQVSRARYVLPLTTLNYSARLPAMATAVPGLFIVNSAHIVNGTLNVNETLQLAERAASQVMDSGRARQQ